MIDTKTKVNKISTVSDQIGTGYATKAEIKAIERGRKQIESGNFYTLEQVLKEYLV